MSFAEKLYHGVSLTSGIKQRNVDDPCGYTCAVIVIQAIKDWRFLITKKAYDRPAYLRADRNFKELRKFFKSEWCALLMEDFEIKPHEILKTLEAELQAAREKDREKEKQKERSARK